MSRLHEYLPREDRFTSRTKSTLSNIRYPEKNSVNHFEYIVPVVVSWTGSDVIPKEFFFESSFHAC